MKKFLALLVCCLGMTAAFAAGNARVAVVNIEKVFNEYYKSRIAEEFLAQQAEAVRIYLTQQTAAADALRAEAARLETNALNPALSGEARSLAVSAAAAAAEQLRIKENELNTYANDRRLEFLRLEEERRAEIISDIQKEIRRRAAAENYAFVLDCSGKSANDLPTVLVFPKQNDITDAVIRELNRTAAQPKTETKP